MSDYLVDHSGDEDYDSTTDEEADVDNDNVDLESIFRCDAGDIQNWMSQAVGTAALEDCRFCELFRASIGIALHLWNAVEGGGLLPKESRLEHLLWMLYFLKVYPCEAAGCSAVGSVGGHRSKNSTKMGLAND